LPGAWRIQEVYDRAKNGQWNLPLLGSFWEGGFFAGYISHTADGNPTHGLIVAPKAQGYLDGSSTPLNPVAWIAAGGTTPPGATSPYDGAANTAIIANGSHPAADYCAALTINGFSDWYLPALYELDIAYHNQKPNATSNDTSWGINDYSVPKRTVTRTAEAPAQTSIAQFQEGNFQQGSNQSYVATAHWSSNAGSTTSVAWGFIFADGRQIELSKNSLQRVRAFRRFAL
jgi:hypothetical protein